MILKLLRILVIATLLMAATAAAGPVQSVQAAVPGSVVYNLYATDGYSTLADGTFQYMYGFIGNRNGLPLSYLDGTGALKTIATGAPSPTGGPLTASDIALQGNAQFPAPLVYASVGDVVELRLKNLGVSNPNAVGNDPHTIHLHGLDVDAANDGVPETSVTAVPANECADGSWPPAGQNCSAVGKQTWKGAGNVVVYMFAPKTAGTYFYHCHQEADIHVQMGMYGALVIYNRSDPASVTGPGMGKGGTLFGWHYDKDVIMLLSEMDVNQHLSEAGVAPFAGALAGSFNPVDYKPQYWFVNGISFPQTIHVDIPADPLNPTTTRAWSYANWIAAHPGYDPMITGSVSLAQKVLIRVINMGFETQPMHMHGFHGKILGSDQRAWTWANTPGVTPWGAGEEKNTLTIGSGEEYDWLINFGLQKVTSTYPAGTQTRYDAAGRPVSNTVVADPAIEDLSGIPLPGVPYLGGPVVSGAQGLPGGSQIFVFHNHDDYKATNNGVYPGGMFTIIVPTP